MKIAHRQFENSINQIGDVTKRARLQAIAKHRERFSAQRLPNKGRDNAPVVQTHARAVGVKDAHDLSVNLMVAMIRHCHRFGETLRFIINPTRPDRVDVAPVIFLLRMDQRVAVTFRSGGQNERSLFVLGQTERVMGAERAHF